MSMAGADYEIFSRGSEWAGLQKPMGTVISGAASDEPDFMYAAVASVEGLRIGGLYTMAEIAK